MIFSPKLVIAHMFHSYYSQHHSVEQIVCWLTSALHMSERCSAFITWWENWHCILIQNHFLCFLRTLISFLFIIFYFFVILSSDFSVTFSILYAVYSDQRQLHLLPFLRKQDKYIRHIDITRHSNSKGNDLKISKLRLGRIFITSALRCNKNYKKCISYK